MALIWARGFSGEKVLALAWSKYAQAKARENDPALTEEQQGAAMVATRKAFAAYSALQQEANEALNQYSKDGKALTHALIIGVGHYTSKSINALSTSVYGAYAFTEWMLNDYFHLNRPLGSVELLISPSSKMGDWTPSATAATALGLPEGEALPGEAATFNAIKSGFEQWLNRAKANEKNAAFLYFSGHGLWKSSPLLLPEDAQIATPGQPFENLIDIEQTLANMINTQPSIQCFFVDACQEINTATTQNVMMELGKTLVTPTNGAGIKKRDASMYLASRPGQKAYGPADDAPFFTQELLHCLKKRAAKEAEDDRYWYVTPQSLHESMLAAKDCRCEWDAQATQIDFSSVTKFSNITAKLCHIEGPPEVFVRVNCSPDESIAEANLSIKTSTDTIKRPKALNQEWVTPVPKGDCTATAQFKTPSLTSTRDFHPITPVCNVLLPEPTPVVSETAPATPPIVANTGGTP